jgi:hypothetical protein
VEKKLNIIGMEQGTDMDQLILGYCNTRDVCHQLSSGIELKYGRLSGNEDVKVKPMEASPNLNLDVAPLLYI